MNYSRRNADIMTVPVVFLALLMFFLFLGCSYSTDGVSVLKEGFVTPPQEARPGVYWYFMDGNLSREGMTRDLEAMVDAGIGYVVFLEVNVGVPRGDVDFMSDEWMDLFCHAVSECERLGIQMVLGIGPGWTGSGGPWVEGRLSMQHLMSSTARIKGGWHISADLPVPSPNPPFFGTGSFTPEMMKDWEDYYEDVAVLAFPTPSGQDSIADIQEKGAFIRAPFSSQPGVKQYLPNVVKTVGEQGLSQESAVDLSEIIDLTEYMDAGGHLEWDAPDGEWTVMRFGARNNGAVTRPAPLPGVGMECDKFSREALQAHLDKFSENIFAALGERPATFGGIKYLHMDSWEMGAQNWTPSFREEFTERRGYDPLPYYPVYSGMIVGDRNVSERFLYDLRLTTQELILENHAGAVTEYAHEHGMLSSTEPYDMMPAADLEFACTADVPMAEFWSEGFGFNTAFAAAEGSSAAHLLGSNVVPAEAFTSQGEDWKQYPGRMKNQADWAFGAGINRFMFHTFQHQPLEEDKLPGMTMGIYGVHWDRNQTWWEMSSGFHTYVARCQHMLQQGRTVADILYLTPESIPHVFKAPASAYDNADSWLPDRKGYNFDACPPGMLYKAEVKGGRIVFPSGASYAVLVLPEWETMSPDLLEKIGDLVGAGATVVGMPPVSAPGLAGYPESETKVKELAVKIWADSKVIVPEGVSDNLYQAYSATASILGSKGLVPDFMSSDNSIRYTHRTTPGEEIYFVANRENDYRDVTLTFRVSGKTAEIWDPMTGNTSLMKDVLDDGERTSFSLGFEGYQSFFVVFSEKGTGAGEYKEGRMIEAMTVSGPWTVTFDPDWGRKDPLEMQSLADWTSNEDPLVKYYSGTAMYRTSFSYDGALPENAWIDLGDVAVMARVKLNGTDCGITWVNPFRIDVSQALTQGDNTLEIEVANLWINRLIGDEAGAPNVTPTFSTFTPYSADDQLVKSGLLGPVRIFAY